MDDRKRRKPTSLDTLLPNPTLMHPEFFAHHGLIVLIGLALFPRLTLLLASFATGGLLWWLGWIFAPHLLVAFLALPYWHSNPVLVIFAWIIALAGTGAEGKAASKASRH